MVLLSRALIYSFFKLYFFIFEMSGSNKHRSPREASWDVPAMPDVFLTVLRPQWTGCKPQPTVSPSWLQAVWNLMTLIYSEVPFLYPVASWGPLARSINHRRSVLWQKTDSFALRVTAGLCKYWCPVELLRHRWSGHIVDQRDILLTILNVFYINIINGMSLAPTSMGRRWWSEDLTGSLQVSCFLILLQ